MATIGFPSDAIYEEVHVGPSTYRNTQRSVSVSKDSSGPGGSNCSLLQLSSKKSTDRQAKLLLIVAIALAVSCVLLAVGIVLLFTKLEQVRAEVSDYANTAADRKICFPCAQLNVSRFGPDEEAAVKLLDVTLDANGEDACCASDARQTQHLLELVYKKNSKPICVKGTENPETPCTSPILSPSTSGVSAAHLLAGLQSTELQQDADTAHIRNWRTDDVTSHLEGIQLTNDRLVIKDTGLYMVYSQTYFSKFVAPTALKSGTLLHHFVYRYNVIYPNGGNQVLLESVRTMTFDPVAAHTDLTSFMAAAFQLVVGDQIYVKVSNISLVSGDEKASFLGVVKFE